MRNSELRLYIKRLKYLTQFTGNNLVNAYFCVLR